MNFFTKTLIGSAIGLASSAAFTQTTNIKGNFKNVVVGEGCASTCINGVCEKTCKGDSQTGGSQSSSQSNSANSPKITKAYDFEDFKDLDVSGFDAEVMFGDEFLVEAQGKAVDLQNLNVDLEVSADKAATLKVSVQGGASIPGSMKIVLPELESLRVGSTSDVVVTGFEQQRLDIDVSQNTDVEIANSKFDSINLNAVGNSDISLAQSKARSAQVALNGNANAVISFSENGDLRGTVDGSSDLEYCGAPKTKLSVLY